MYVKQLSIFVENKYGRLAEITKKIADAGIDIRAISIADTTNFGILRLIVDKPDKAEKALKELGLTVKLTDVIVVEIDDKPGNFAETLDLLTKAEIVIEYIYAFISKKEGKACVILRVDNNEKAIIALTEGNVKVLKSEEIYSM
ncbi:ACT domain-containing protein [Eubacteriales bacterium OttesenSCG-928-G02]|nr:ACT domain-containing protein [Eubacteriales bacterium OttesenSCG-928-G02]